MRFCDFFIDYKIGIKDIDKYIKYNDLPFYRKIFVTIAYIAILLLIIFLITLKLDKIIYLPLFVSIIFFSLLIIFNFVDSSKKNMIKMNEYYTKISQQRINVLREMLREYEVDFNDVNKIEMLMEQAKIEQKRNNPFLGIEKPMKILYLIIVPVIVFVAKEVAKVSNIYTITMAASVIIIVSVCVVSMFYSLKPLMYLLFYRDYEKYNILIYDLKQMILFEGNRKS